MKREKILRHQTVPIDVQSNKNIGELLGQMAYIGFQGGRLGEAVNVWTRMLKKRDIVIWLGVAGAMIPAGMRKILTYLIRRRMIDVLVTTGANIYHDCYEALGGKHFLGTESADDVTLRRLRINRMFDVYADEKKFYWLDILIERELCSRLRENYPYSTREIISHLGRWLGEKAKDHDSITVAAAEMGVPVFVPALCDSSLGFSMAFAKRRRGRRIVVDHIKDVDESSRITEKARWSGVIIVGGGVPKNFIQQTAVIASYQTRHDRTHQYALQFTTDMPVWGGLSGSTFEEAQSWGKYNPKAEMVICHSDATIALPIAAHALSDRFKRLRRNVPVFEWGPNNLDIRFESRKL